MNLIEIRPDPNLISNHTIMEDLLLDCHCALFLTDMSDEETFKPMRRIMDLLDNNKYPELKKILVQNKSDIEPESPSDEINKYIFEHLEIDNIKISVKDDKNLEELKLKIYNEINSPNKKVTPMDKVKKRNIKCDLDDINIEGNMKNINLILLGNSGVGKTNFMIRYSVNEFSQRFISTIGTNEEIKIIKIKDENNNKKNYK
jgi:GTPase SAR1 family protein